MSNWINNTEKNYARIPNHLITDDLSNGAKIMLCYLLGKPNEWTINNKDIMSRLKIGSNSTISKYWKELIDGGWVSRKRERKENGDFGSYDYSYIQKPLTTESVVSEKCRLSNTDSNSNTELKNNSNIQSNQKNDSPAVCPTDSNLFGEPNQKDGMALPKFNDEKLNQLKASDTLWEIKSKYPKDKFLFRNEDYKLSALYAIVFLHLEHKSRPQTCDIGKSTLGDLMEQVEKIGKLESKHDTRALLRGVFDMYRMREVNWGTVQRIVKDGKSDYYDLPYPKRYISKWCGTLDKVVQYVTSKNKRVIAEDGTLEFEQSQKQFKELLKEAIEKKNS